MECFPYDDQLDRCSHCLADGRCLKGDPRRSTYFLCRYTEYHLSRQCQFHTKSFSFTLAQLFLPDLHSAARGKTTISLLIFFPLFALVLVVL